MYNGYTQKGKHVRTWLSPDGVSPLCPPEYNGCVIPYNVSLQGGVTRHKFKCPSDSSRSFKVVEEVYPETEESIETVFFQRVRHDEYSGFLDLKRQKHPFDALLIYDTCADPTNIHDFSKVEIFKDVIATNYERDEVGSFDGYNSSEDILEKLSVDVGHYYEFIKPDFFEVGEVNTTCGTIDGFYFTEYTPCGRTKSIPMYLGVGTYDTTNYGTVVYLYYSIGGPNNWGVYPIATISTVNDLDLSISVVNDKIVVINSTTYSVDFDFFYIDIDDFLNGYHNYKLKTLKRSDRGVTHISRYAENYYIFTASGHIYKTTSLDESVLYPIMYAPVLGTSFVEVKIANTGEIVALRNDGYVVIIENSVKVIPFNQNHHRLKSVTLIKNVLYGIDTSGLLWFKRLDGYQTESWNSGVYTQFKGRHLWFDEYGVVSYLVNSQGLLLSITGGASYQLLRKGNIENIYISRDGRNIIFSEDGKIYAIQDKRTNTHSFSNGTIYNQSWKINQLDFSCPQEQKHPCPFDGVFGEFTWELTCNEGSLYFVIRPNIFDTECSNYNFQLKVVVNGITSYYPITGDPILIGPIVGDGVNDLNLIVSIVGDKVGGGCFYQSHKRLLTVPCSLLTCEGDCLACMSECDLLVNPELADNLVFCYNC